MRAPFLLLVALAACTSVQPAPPRSPDGPTEVADGLAEAGEVRTLTSESGTYALAFDASVWNDWGSAAGTSEFALFAMGEDGAGGMHARTVWGAEPADIGSLRAAVLRNAGRGGVEPVVLSERPISVPGGSGLQIEFEAQMGLIPFAFVTSAFASDRGTVQVHTYTLVDDYASNREAMLRFHEGVRLIDFEQ